MELSPAEVRVLGSLVEKQLATPQYYPLTLHALIAACNQSSNREPVTAYGEAAIREAIDALREKGLVRIVHSSPGSRTTKYRHVLDERWGLDGPHRAVLAVLLLRGPQTLGELRTRTDRMAGFGSLADVEEVVRLLAAREEPLVTLVPRAPGQKEARAAHLLASSPESPPLDTVSAAPDDLGSPRSVAGTAAAAPSHDGQGLAERVELLEAEVALLRTAVDRLGELERLLE